MQSVQLPSPVETDDAYENAGHKGNGKSFDEPTAKHGRKKPLGRDPKKRGYRTKRGRGSDAGRNPLVGAVSRKSKQCIIVSVESLREEDVSPVIRAHIPKGAKVFTDEHNTYSFIGREGYDHQTVAHSKGEWANGECHINNAENLWSFWRPFSRPHRGFSAEHLSVWSAWLAWLRNHRMVGLDWVKSLINTTISVPGKMLRFLVRKSVPPIAWPLFSCQGSVCTIN